jgi:hypothetical protein
VVRGVHQIEKGARVRQFDFYEFTGILVPGATALAGSLLLFPDFLKPESIKDFNVGGLGLFLVLAYVLGHLVQAIGNGFESGWWKLWGGMPTDWVRTKPARLLAPSQVAALEKTAKERLGLEDLQIAHSTPGQWYAITRQVYAEVAGAGRASRIDVFNGNYGLNRGIAAGLLVVLAVALLKSPVNWAFVGGAGVAAALAIYRMHRFARHYARELFVQFLQLPARESNKEKKQ